MVRTLEAYTVRDCTSRALGTLHGYEAIEVPSSTVQIKIDFGVSAGIGLVNVSRSDI